MISRSAAFAGVLWSVGLTQGVTLGVAEANPFFIGRFSGLDGDPVTESAWALYWNPAGLARPGGLVDLHGLVVNRAATYDRDAALNGVGEDEAAANAGLNHTGALGLAPALAGRYGLALGDFDLGLAAGFYVARAGATNWRRAFDAPAEYPGAVDGPQRWATVNTSMILYSPSAAVAVRHRPTGLSLGVAPVYTFVTLSTLKARNPDGTTRLVDERGNLAEGRILLEDGETQDLHWIVGAQWQPSDDLSFGVTWHSGVTHQLEGTAYISFGTADEAVETSSFNLPVAQTVRVGAAIGVTDDLTLRPSFAWHDWSVMDRQVAVNVRNGEQLMDLPRDFDDTVIGRLRADYRLAPGWVLHGGIGYETAATPEHTFEPGLAESASYELAAGLSVDLTEMVGLSTSFFWQQFEDQTVRNSVNKPTTNGYYTDARQYLTVDLEVRL